MQNLNRSAKSKGVVLFAFNTSDVDYVEIARRAAQLIKHTLKLPVTLITDALVLDQNFDSVIYAGNESANARFGYANGTEWRNSNRYCAYELSPYDETLLLDTDYLMLDDSLLKLFDVCTDYQIVYNNDYIKSTSTNNMGALSLPFVWATAIVFKRTPKSALLFDMVSRVQDNYDYYRSLYKLDPRNFRNDYAFAIANNVLNGYVRDNKYCIPYTMLTVEFTVSAISTIGSMLAIKNTTAAYVVPVQNLHVIDKQYLLSNTHKEFVDQICQKVS